MEVEKERERAARHKKELEENSKKITTTERELLAKLLSGHHTHATPSLPSFSPQSPTQSSVRISDRSFRIRGDG